MLDLGPGYAEASYTVIESVPGVMSPRNNVHRVLMVNIPTACVRACLVLLKPSSGVMD